MNTTKTAARSWRRRIRSRWVAAAVVATVAFTAACSSRDHQDSAAVGDSADAITIVDQRGETVVLDGPAQTVAFTVMPAPAIFTAVDQSYDRVVGINQSTLVANQGGMFATMFPDSTSSRVVAGSDFMPNVETLLDLEPDVVVQWADLSPEAIPLVEEAGLPVVGLEYGTQEDLETWIMLFSQIAGKPERGEELVAWHQAEIAEIREKVAAQAAPRPRAMILSRDGDTYSVNADTYYNFQIDLTGGDAVTDEIVSDNAVVGPEQILEWDPEVILLSGFDESTPEEIYADPRLASVSAVQNQRVYKTPLGGYRWQVSSVESPLMWQWMYSVFYPGEQDGVLRANVKDAFEDLFVYDISEEEIDQVLRFDVNADAADYDQFRG